MHLSESVLARIMITVRTTPGQIPDFDVRELEARLVAAARRWDDDLKDALIETLGEARGNELFRQFGAAFPAGYREEFAARAAVPDIEMMAKLTDAEPLAHDAVPPARGRRPATLRFKLFHRGAPVTLSDSLPMLEQHGPQGARRAPATGSRPTGCRRSGCTISGLHVRRSPTPRSRSTRCTPCSRMRSRRVFRGEVENDDFNRLVVAAPAARRRDRRAARLREVSAADRLPAVAGVHRGDARRARATSRACSSSCSSCASIPRSAPAAQARALRAVRAIEHALDGGREPVRGPRAARSTSR